MPMIDAVEHRTAEDYRDAQDPRPQVPLQRQKDIRAGSAPPLSQHAYLERFKYIVTEMVALVTAKNSDYASGDDAFQNFRMVEVMGLTDVPTGILTRMTDKFQRVINLSKRGAKVKPESIRDTLRDLAVYSIILDIWFETEGKR